MDAVEYLKEKMRMCDATRCAECLIGDIHNNVEIRTPEEAVAIVEKWAAEHPVVTNAQKFEEVFGWKIDRYFDKLPAAWWDEPYVEPKEAE